MKKLIILLLLIAPLFVLGQDVKCKPNANDLTKMSMTLFDVQTDTVDGKAITMFTIDNYCQDNVKGELVLMYTESVMFGIKFHPYKGDTRYWVIIAEYVVEIENNIWGDLRI